jgi:hypothetical protein
MDRGPRIEQMRRFILTREQEVLSKIGEMPDDQLRWIVRVLADCLDETSRTVCLQDYSEHLPLERMQAFVAAFVPQYTHLALADLDLKAQVEGSGLNSLTEEELQSMSCAEKWYLLASEEKGLTVPQLRRELGRFLFCRSIDLYHEPSLPMAAIEFPSYFEIQESLATLPPEDVQGLTGRIVPKTQELDKAMGRDAEEILRAVREEIAQAISLDKTLESLFDGAMRRINLGGKDMAEETPSADTEGMSREELQLSVKALTELMRVDEMRRELSPLKDRYPSFSQIPETELKDLVQSLAQKLGGRTILSFTNRYRSGSLVTRHGVSPEVWALLPDEKRLQLLLEDNASMDAAQMARHISRIFMSNQYEMLHDPSAQMSLLNEPLYHALHERIIEAFGKESDQTGLREFNREVTVRMLEVERAISEDRHALLLKVRKGIATAFRLPDTLLDPETAG